MNNCMRYSSLYTICIMIQVAGLEVERISERYGCRWSQSWSRGEWQNDLEWVKQYPGRCHSMLSVCLRWHPQWLHTIKLLNEDVAFVDCLFTLALTTRPETWVAWIPSQNLNKWEQYWPPLLCRFSVWETLWPTHVIPELATGRKTQHGQNEQWIVNSNKNLGPWNDVYDL